MSDVDHFTSIWTFVVSIISVATTIIGAIVWKIRQVIKTSNLQVSQDHTLKNLINKVEKVCNKISSLEEEHVVIQSKYDELVKELYKLIGEVKVMRDRSNK